MAMLVEKGRVFINPGVSVDSPVLSSAGRGFKGGMPPKRPTTFSGAGGILPGDNNLGEIESPKQLREKFSSLWESRLPQEVLSQGTEVILGEIARVIAVIGNILSDTGISSYGVDHLKQVAIISFMGGNSPAQFLPVGKFVTDRTFIERSYSPVVELNLIDHFIEHESRFYPDTPADVLQETYNAWYVNLTK